MDKRTEYVEKLSAQLVEWDNQIDQLKDRVKSLAPGSNEDYSPAIEALQHKRDEAALKLQGISAASDDEWEDLKTGTEKVWDEVRNNLRDAVLKIK
jgi:chromosome segregation ATPase